MSLAVTHFAVGADLTVLLVTFLAPGVQYPRAVAVFGGGWAMLPDVHRATPVFESWLRRVHDTHLADVFWLHRTLDLLDARDSALVAGGAVLALLLVTAVAERRTYRALRGLRAENGER